MVTQRLTAEDWIKAAFRALKNGGVAAVKVEPLARELKVSKGSFYWHFKDQTELKTRMIEHWRSKATLDIIEATQAQNISAKDKLQLLIEVAVSDLDDPYGGPETEASIRAWSFHDETVRAAQSNVDRERLDFLIGLFVQDGFSKPKAHSSAQVFLSSYHGSSHHSREERRSVLQDVLELVYQA